MSIEAEPNRRILKRQQTSTWESSSEMEWYSFTNSEKEHLRKAWRTMESNKQTIGCDIYEMIFNQCPEARKLFPKMNFHNSRPDRKQNEFTFQALRFIQVIEGAINSLDNLESLDPILDNLGRRHGKLEVYGKFRSYYWSVFLECTIYNIRKQLNSTRKFPDNEIDSVIILWRFLLRDVMRKIKIGYNADIAHRMAQMSIDDGRSCISSRKESMFEENDL